jgi:acetaldehyde dehydrogenase (acetylating)
VGYTNELLPSMTLGPGTFGKSIISENVSAKHLINIKRLAFETRPINKIEDKVEVKEEVQGGERREGTRIKETGDRTQKLELRTQQAEPGSPTHSWMEEIEERIRLKAGNQPTRPRSPAEEKSKKEESKEAKYGSGMTVDDVERVMREFKK